jgi:DNA-binding NarL/FixJ family response regulator
MNFDIRGKFGREPKASTGSTEKGCVPFRVVVVDDSEIVRNRLRAMVAEIDSVAVVGEAETGQEGLALTRARCPDLVVLDLQMPGSGGLDVLPEIKALDSPPIVAVLTNHGQLAYRKRALKLGADFFFDKASQLRGLEQTIEKLRQE